MKLVYGLMALLLTGNAAIAQEDNGVIKKENKKGTTITINSDGVKITDGKTTKAEDKSISVEFANLDLGINTLRDNTVYNTATVNNFLQVPQNLRNTNLFDLRTAKSINVNLWPVMARIKILKASRQKIYASTGVGLQVYNFRYSQGIEYVNNPLPLITLDTMGFRKNKLTITYLSVPLNFTFKTKLDKKLWLVYGFGVTGGYRISSYTKQVSDRFGKQKDHGNFDLSDFNGCVTGEFGLDNYFRLYASYQLTNMYKDVSGLDQHPFSIGLRFGGI